jgi:hypothetical protein
MTCSTHRKYRNFLFIYNLNQQSEFTFYKLTLWSLQCLDEESSSGESSVPQIRSTGQFLLSRLFSSLSVLRNRFSWVSSVVWCCNLSDIFNVKKKLWAPRSMRDVNYWMGLRKLVSSKLVQTFADRGCHVVSVTNPYDHIVGFLDQRKIKAIQEWTGN